MIIKLNNGRHRWLTSMEIYLFRGFNVVTISCNLCAILEIRVSYDSFINNFTILLSNCTRIVIIVIYLKLSISLDKVSTHVTRLSSSFANIALEKSEQIKKGMIWFAVCLTISFLAFFISLSYVPFWSFHRINFFYMANTEIIVVEIIYMVRFQC